MVLWAVDSLVLLGIHLRFFHGDLDHCNNIVTLPGNQSFVTECLIVKFNQEAFISDGFVDSLNGAEMIGALTVVLVSVEENVLHEIELDYPLLIFLPHHENEKWEKVPILEHRYD